MYVRAAKASGLSPCIGRKMPVAEIVLISLSPDFRLFLQSCFRQPLPNAARRTACPKVITFILKHRVLHLTQLIVDLHAGSLLEGGDQFQDGQRLASPDIEYSIFLFSSIRRSNSQHVILNLIQ